MRGSIRTFVGLLVVFGSVGGMDNATDAQLPVVLLFAVAGLALMYSGVRAMNRGING
jgi:uncharacterized membrane protein